ncbi:MAG: hypothetical protein LLF97_07215 [Planctomycetaceae bacterium]|nr:hypothetical protein [Planctomycetaceae bacterium]
MSRRFGWAMLLAAGVVFGMAIGSHEKIRAAADDDGKAQEANVLDELKEIKGDVAAIKTVLKSGTVQVAIVMNPDAPRN